MDCTPTRFAGEYPRRSVPRISKANPLPLTQAALSLRRRRGANSRSRRTPPVRPPPRWGSFTVPPKGTARIVVLPTTSKRGPRVPSSLMDGNCYILEAGGSFHMNARLAGRIDSFLFLSMSLLLRLNPKVSAAPDGMWSYRNDHNDESVPVAHGRHSVAEPTRRGVPVFSTRRTPPDRPHARAPSRLRPQGRRCSPRWWWPSTRSSMGTRAAAWSSPSWRAEGNPLPPC